MNKTASFTIGKVTGVHGLSGNLKVFSFAHSIDSFNPGSQVFLKPAEKKGKSFNILKVSPRKKGLLLSLEGIDNRTLAEDFVESEIIINRDQLPELENDSWYWQDLINLKVFEKEKGLIGRVKEIFPTGAHDILVVVDNGSETLVPMHRHFVKSIDTKKETINVSLPEAY